MMSTSKIAALGLMVMSGFTDAQTCTANPTTVSNFDATAFKGNWHM